MNPIIALLGLPRDRALVDDAARIARRRVVHATLAEAPQELARRVGRGLVVHDFAPDPGASVRWLNAVSAEHPGTSVFALLDPPLSDTAEGLLSASRRFRLVGLASSREIDAAWLAARLGGETHTRMSHELFRGLAARLRNDPVLTLLSERQILHPRPHATLARLLRDSGVNRSRFVRRARGAGFEPPLRFLHLLRVLEAVSLLGEGWTVADIADHLGYGSEGTLRGHVREVLGCTPSEAAGLTVEEVLRRGVPEPLDGTEGDGEPGYVARGPAPR